MTPSNERRTGREQFSNATKQDPQKSHSTSEADRQDNDIFGARELSTLSLARGVCDSEGQ